MANDEPDAQGQFSTAQVRTRRLWRRAQHTVLRLSERPAFRAVIVILGMAVVTAFLLNQWERRYAENGADGPYGTLPKTIRNVTVFLFSGFDADQPQTDFGFVLAMICLFLGFGILALLTGDLASLLVTAAMTSKGRRRIRSRNHIVLCGWHHTTQSLVQQLISRERNPRREIVIIDEHPDEIHIVDPDVHVVRGDPTEMDVLRRANASQAHAAIIPTNWNLSEDVQDSRTTLSALAIRELNENIYTCVEVLHPQNKRHIQRTQIDEAICLGDFGRTLIASAVVSHGLSRLIGDILTFNQGSEIYRVRLPASLNGQSFRWLLGELNVRYGCLLLSVERDGNTHTNPQGEFVLQAGDWLFILAAGYPRDLEALESSVPTVPNFAPE